MGSWLRAAFPQLNWFETSVFRFELFLDGYRWKKYAPPFPHNCHMSCFCLNFWKLKVVSWEVGRPWPWEGALLRPGVGACTLVNWGTGCTANRGCAGTPVAACLVPSVNAAGHVQTEGNCLHEQEPSHYSPRNEGWPDGKGHLGC